MAQLTEDDFHFRPDPGSNSIAIIIQHLSGNMISRWTNFLSEDGEKPWRNRDDEFEKAVESKEELIQKWNAGWDCVFTALNSLKEEELAKTIFIRHEPQTVGDAISRQIAHYANHVGQIVYIGKMCLDNNWASLSIPKGNSKEFNKKMVGS